MVMMSALNLFYAEKQMHFVGECSALFEYWIVL